MAELLFMEPCVYRNPEYIFDRAITDQEHELLIKLLFLCDMRQEYNENFFGGNSPITADFFDTWWTLTKSDEAQDVPEVLRRVRADDLQYLSAQFRGRMPERIRELLESTAPEDP